MATPTSKHVGFGFCFSPAGYETGLPRCTLSRLLAGRRRASRLPWRVHALPGYQGYMREQNPLIPAVRGPPPKARAP